MWCRSCMATLRRRRASPSGEAKSSSEGAFRMPKTGTAENAETSGDALYRESIRRERRRAPIERRLTYHASHGDRAKGCCILPKRNCRVTDAVFLRVRPSCSSDQYWKDRTWSLYVGICGKAANGQEAA